MIFDLTVIAISVIILFIGWRKGILKMLGGALIPLISFLIAKRFAPDLSEILQRQAFFLKIGEKIMGQSVASLGTQLTPGNQQSSMLWSFLGLDPKLFSLVSFGSGSSGTSLDPLAAFRTQIGWQLYRNLSLAISALVLFALCSIILGIVLKLLSKLLDKTPVLGRFNRFMGLLPALLILYLLNRFFIYILPGLFTAFPTILTLMNGSYLLGYMIQGFGIIPFLQQLFSSF